MKRIVRLTVLAALAVAVPGVGSAAAAPPSDPAGICSRLVSISNQRGYYSPGGQALGCS